ncbi:cation diffusion facilitator family transporter [Thiothrix subterranea]|uniref:Cation diffusion facilitator family transporter n=1 Tax=Thiothrix subterranea TaxID=2735563 RepID=A0AA51MPB3_9GAMM|nr:cation diffusion facilitator family transporter [Thiothrix subterranea]MDQ5770349.1 cation diffusion facilitator family transporter [Thiothrix subterranea]WML86786.1 cation diffusion facilitator family transporter [Thiothrix subterranea]
MSGHQHTVTDTRTDDNSRKAVTQRVAFVGMSVNIFLVIVQIIGGILTHSQALIADAMHTLSDLVGDVVVLFAAHHAGKAADANHPYGHGRIETLATVILGLLLGGVAAAIFLQAWDRLSGDEPLITPEPWAMAIAALAIIGKEGLYHYTVHVAKRISSPMLKASAWHHRSDAISSVLVLLAIGGAQLGFPWLDSVAAILVAAMIFYMAIQLILESTSELVDTGLDALEVQEMRDFICAIDGVESVHLLRTRRMGGRVLADAHLQVDGRISVSEGHHISDTVMYRLRRQFPAISDVIIHIDPEDDETVHPSKNLPSRVELLAALHAQPETAALWNSIDDLTLHYQGGKLQLDVILLTMPPATALSGFKNACSSIPAIECVNFFTKIVH